MEEEITPPEKEASPGIPSPETTPPEMAPLETPPLETIPSGITPPGISSDQGIGPEIKAAELLKTKESPIKKFLPLMKIGLVLLVLLLAFKFFLPKFRRIVKPKEVVLNYWGLWEQKNVIEPIISEFQKEHPNIKIDYLQQYNKDYRERLQSALARGEGPDIFRFHNTWLPMFKNELSPVPPDVFDATSFEATFYPVVRKDLRYGNNYYGIPLMFDCLSLFINKEIFEAAGKIPPGTWDELRKTAIELTVYDQNGRIKTAGVSLGETANIDHWSDILALMMLQNGASLNNPAACTQEAIREVCLGPDALTFYTLFSTTDRVWDETMPPSTYAFATGKVAMIFAPSWRVFNIKEMNPNLQFKIVSVPQLPGQKIAWATYWVEGVSKKSKHQGEAWEFLKFLSKKETMQKLYSEESKTRLFGEIPPRVDMADLYRSDSYVAPFLEQAPYAQSWYLASRTWDNGINEKMIKYFEDAINAVLEGKGTKEALQVAAQGVSQVLSQYQVSY